MNKLIIVCVLLALSSCGTGHSGDAYWGQISNYFKESK